MRSGRWTMRACLPATVLGCRTRRSPGPSPRLLQRLLPGLLAVVMAAWPATMAPVRVGTDVSPKPRYLALIVMDGFRADYTSLAPMPALHALMRAGTTYDRAWVGQVEAVTPASHATLATGRFPNHDGVVGLEWRDPATGRAVYAGWDQNLQRSELEDTLRASGTGSLAAAMKATAPSAKVVSISSEKVYAADAWGGPAADYIIDDRQTAGNVLVPTGVVGHEPPASFRADPALREPLPLKRFTTWDYLSAKMAVRAVEQFRPRLLMVNLPGADVYGHASGGITAPGIMKRVVAGLDRDIARIVAAYRAAGIYNQTLFVVTADHGMSPNVHAISAAAAQGVIYAAGTREILRTGGTASYIYLRDPQQSETVATSMAKLGGVDAAYYQVRRNGAYGYVHAPGSTIPAALDAAYRYLLGTVAGPEAPDVAAPFKEDTIGQVRTSAYGHHGGLNWGVQHIPLVLAGPGIQAGRTSRAPARLVDIPATIARELGLSLAGMDGIVLADALKTPTQGEAALQARLSPALSDYQDALLASYTRRVAADQRQSLHPPPQAPLRP